MGASVPSDQATVRLFQDAVPWLGEEHQPVAGAVRIVELVDGASPIAGDVGRKGSALAEPARGGRQEAAFHRRNSPDCAIATCEWGSVIRVGAYSDNP